MKPLRSHFFSCLKTRSLKPIFLGASLFLLFLPVDSAKADPIQLKSGKVLEGQMIEKTDQYIKIRTGQGVVHVPLNLVSDSSLHDLKQIQNFGPLAVEKATPPNPTPTQKMVTITEEQMADQFDEETRQALEGDPTSARNYNDRGVALRMKGDQRQAIEHFSKAISLDPHYAEAYRNRSYSYASSEVGFFEPALADLQKAIELKPDDSELYFDRAVLFYQMKNADAAWEDVRKIQSMGYEVPADFLAALQELKALGAGSMVQGSRSMDSPGVTISHEGMKHYENEEYKISFWYPQEWVLYDDDRSADFQQLKKKMNNLICVFGPPPTMLGFVNTTTEFQNQIPEVILRNLQRNIDWKKDLPDRTILVEPKMITLGSKKVVYYQTSRESQGQPITEGFYQLMVGPLMYLFYVGDFPAHFENSQNIVQSMIETVETGDLSSFYSKNAPVPVSVDFKDWLKVGMMIVLLISGIGRAFRKKTKDPGSPSLASTPIWSSIDVRCRCGAHYSFRPEYAGKLVKCPACNAEFRIPLASSPPAFESGSADEIFHRDKFFINQKVALSEKYFIYDEQGRKLLFVERPMLGRNFLAGFAGIFAAIVIFIGTFVVAAMFMDTHPMIFVGVLVIGILLAITGGILVAIAMERKRHIAFYRDESKMEKIMEVRQESKTEFPFAIYTVRENGTVLAQLKKNRLFDLLRIRWDCLKPDGSLLCRAKEDSFILALVRRFIPIEIFDWIRSNFVFCVGHDDEVIGEFNRKFTIVDKYVLDLTADRLRFLDRRIALALAVILDTVERR